MTGYRSSNEIIMMILEVIIRSEMDSESEYHGALKSHIIKECSLKSLTADKYLTKLEHANYVLQIIREWGDREVIVYQITAKGFERYEWFVKINSELM